MLDRRPSLEMCRPVEEHARLIMQWRNDPHTLAMFYHREPKTWDRFWLEFRGTYFSQPRLPPLFVRMEHERVAFLRHLPAQHPENEAGRTVGVSINVAPGARGRGIGRAALALGCDHLRDAGVDCVLAEIRVENETSLRAFAAAGFRRVDETDKLVEDTGERCRIVRFVRDLTPRY